MRNSAVVLVDDDEDNIDACKVLSLHTNARLTITWGTILILFDDPENNHS